MLVFDLVSKALARSKSFSLIFILNFCLAIASLSYLQFFKSSIDSSLDSKAKSLLGADLVVSSRFAINDQQKEQIKASLPKIKAYDEGISTVSMVASSKRARLMELVQINENFPFYGGLTFQDNTITSKSIPKEDEVWAYKEALDLLGLQKNDEIKIGSKQYKITKVIVEDSLKTVSFSGFMPKVFLSSEGLKRSELLKFGSTARYKLNFLFEKDFTNAQLEELENKLESKLDRTLRVLSPNDGRDRLLNVLNFLTNFLSLVSLISFFLGLVGLIYLYSGFLRKHQNDINVLNDIGLNKKTLISTYLVHLFTLIFISSIIVFAFIAMSAQFIGPVIQQYVDFTFNFSLDYTFFAKSALVLFVLSLSIGIPLILPMISKEKRSFIKTVISFLPFVVFLLLLANFVTPSKFIGFYFALSVLTLILILFIIGTFILRKFDFSGHFNNLAISLAIKNITRQKKTSLTLFSAILLCTAFFSLIPQVGTSLSNVLTKSVEERPRFFVIDAKEEELESLKNDVSNLNAKLENEAAMIRARIVSINNNKPKELDEENNNSSRNSAVNLSYRNDLKPTEQIIEGREFSGSYDSSDFSKPVELSVEKRYAQRRGISLGDEVVFDVLGIELKTKVVNIRTVKWTEFTPNFFFVLQEGAINNAPKTILATISYGDYDATKVLLELTDKYPSLTILDVKSLFESFASIVQDVTTITEKMSFYSIAIGLIMSFIIIQYQMNLQKNNILRLKMIGIKNKTIKNSFLLEYGLITFIASILGITLGSVGSYFISDILFESYWDFRADILFVYLLLIPALTLIVVNFFTRKIIHQKENILFGE